MSRFVFDPEEHTRGSKWFADWHRADYHEDGAASIDLDCVGFCALCNAPLYLVEATRGRMRKNASVTETLGTMLGVPVFVAYQDKTGAHPGEICWDERSAGRHHGWLPAELVWAHLMSIRETHRCEEGAVAS